MAFPGGLGGAPGGYGGGLFAALVKRRVFVSYHHAGDQLYYDSLARTYSQALDVFSDTSLDRIIDSDNTDYTRWKINQDNIKGSSCTIVLLGAETPNRKYVDWEIYYTLEANHGLLGVALPTCPRDWQYKVRVPDRFHEDYQSGHAVLIDWNSLNAQTLKNAIETAVGKPSYGIKNTAPLRQRNG